MTRLVDLTGQKFGRLTVVSREPTKNGKTRWKSLCECGNTSVADYGALAYGTTTSCGCYIKERRGQSSITHGATGTETHNIWRGMLSRCNSPNTAKYGSYVGRGISVCEEWKDFAVFLADMGEKPEGMTLDRIDNDGNYCKLNCRWTTPRIQAINRRSTVWHTFGGVEMTSKDFASSIGTTKQNVSKWGLEGLTDEDMIVRANNIKAGIRNHSSPPLKPRTPKPLNPSEFANLPHLGRL